MKVVSFIISAAVTVALIIILDKPIGTVPPVGKFVSPQHGFWQNADAADKNYSGNLSFPELSSGTTVYFDDRLVPHVFAANEYDAWFVQGYLHAKFRLWQMEFQTHAAAGRLSEVLGAGPDSAYLNNDRNMRRVGMVYGAKRSLVEMEKDDDTRRQVNAYTAGVNSYISNLNAADLPLEYRLLNYAPEKWTNFKTALFLKYMSYDLTGYETDIEYTNARSFFSEEDFNKLYPIMNDSLSPIIPRGTSFDAAGTKPEIPSTADSLYFNFQKSSVVNSHKPDKANGSNNWAVAGSRTRSGKPILCNDPHLGLNLPALWFEMQITTPEFNVYGVSFPGAPAIIIGFNDSIAWGVTNAARDVRDYHEIEFRDDARREYRYDGEWKKAEHKIDTYFVKDGPEYYDTVVYTVFGPVMYDQHYSGKGRVQGNRQLAVRWKAHDPSNELKTFSLLDRAKNYDDYERALTYFTCPGQNFAFASKSGEIAIWQQGAFPAKWRRQGDFILPGNDSAYIWQGDIPQRENLHHKNPLRGFVSSANQQGADTSYPYYLGGHYDHYRGFHINRYLSDVSNADVASMQKMQNDNFNPLADEAIPLLDTLLSTAILTADEKKYLDILLRWDRRNDGDDAGPTIFTVWFGLFEKAVWNDELSKVNGPVTPPDSYTLVQALKRDTAFSFVDNITTSHVESISDIASVSFRDAVRQITAIERNGRLQWSRYKDAGIRHLLRMEPLSRFHLNTGGGENIINATKQFHGPSWKMIVHLDDTTEAYGIYPGGQSGNPGSRFYDPFVTDWAKGSYYPLWVMKKEDADSPRVMFVMTFN